MISVSGAVSALILLSTLSLASTTTHNASYDDLATIPAKGSLTPVGVYMGLSYSKWNIDELSILNESASGVIPHSDPNVAHSENDVSSPPSVTVKGTTTKSFTPKSFWFGCPSELKQGVVDVAVACNITVKGYKTGSSSPVASQTFEFVPLEPVDVMNPLQFGTFSTKFANIQTANFSVQPPTGAGIDIDNLYYTTQS